MRRLLLVLAACAHHPRTVRWLPYTQAGHERQLQRSTAQAGAPPPPCISYTNVHNYYGPYAYCSLDKGVACAQHIQLPTHTCAQATCAEIGNSGRMGCIRLKKKIPGAPAGGHMC